MRIVVVEDEAPIREGMAKILSRINSDYELVGKAADGKEGYRLIKELKPDLVIMDICMPKMDGLTMLKKLREEQLKCKVLVLSAYSDFYYAQQAINLKIENYLLKPIKIPELKRALRQVEEVIAEERNEKQIFSMENILLACMHGQMQEDEKLDENIKEKYGISIEESADIFIIWLGSQYTQQKAEVRNLLESVGENTLKFNSCVLESDVWSMLIMVIFRTREEETQKEYFQKSVIPILSTKLDDTVVYLWQSVDRLLDMPEALQEIEELKEWNLIFPKGTLISQELIEQQDSFPLKYPIELEDQAKQTVLNQNREELIQCFQKLYIYCKEEVHTPTDIKQLIIRMIWAVFNVYKEKIITEINLDIQNILQDIIVAVSWKQVENVLIEIPKLFDFPNEEEDETVSEMVKKAKMLIRKYYDQGITLEEIADKLYVSEEYLSAQFKKETGSTFSETIRKYRIERVKDLLLNTHLKLNQIAELAGYTDPKYMSKVFKEEVGMLPNEFRKSVH